MNTSMKRIVKGVAVLLSWPARLVPGVIRRGVVTGLMLVESRMGSPTVTLPRLFSLHDDLEVLIAERALAYGDGEHPKHRLMRYHDFFVERIPKNSHVLDVGCGYGAVSRSIAELVEDVTVVGVDISEENIEHAQTFNSAENIQYILGDALDILYDKDADVIVLSNVLEHIEDRIGFLCKLVRRHKPRLLLIRVPSFERNWQVPLRKELGIYYFSDKTHYIEHTLEEFCSEMESADLKIQELKLCWGEIWAKCQPKQ